jgi:hypothetical protein
MLTSKLDRHPKKFCRVRKRSPSATLPTIDAFVKDFLSFHMLSQAQRERKSIEGIPSTLPKLTANTGFLEQRRAPNGEMNSRKIQPESRGNRNDKLFTISDCLCMTPDRRNRDGFPWKDCCKIVSPETNPYSRRPDYAHQPEVRNR